MHGKHCQLLLTVILRTYGVACYWASSFVWCNVVWLTAEGTPGSWCFVRGTWWGGSMWTLVCEEFLLFCTCCFGN